jgi:hypothetical protein
MAKGEKTIFSPACSVKRHKFFSLFLGWSGTEFTTSEANYWPIVTAPDDDECRAIGGMFGRGNRSTRRKLAPVPLCPPQFLRDLTRPGWEASD